MIWNHSFTRFSCLPTLNLDPSPFRGKISKEFHRLPRNRVLLLDKTVILCEHLMTKLNPRSCRPQLSYVRWLFFQVTYLGALDLVAAASALPLTRTNRLLRGFRHQENF